MTEKKYTIGDYTNCQYDICEIIKDDYELYCVVGHKYADMIIEKLEENERLKKENTELKEAMKRMMADMMGG